MNVKPGDVIEVKEKSKKLAVVQDRTERSFKIGNYAPWITLDVDAVKGTFTASIRARRSY
jgi:small subunit ribosomal protein S4